MVLGPPAIGGTSFTERAKIVPGIRCWAKCVSRKVAISADNWHAGQGPTSLSLRSSFGQFTTAVVASIPP